MAEQAGAGDTTLSPIVQVHRPARALIGWMQPAEGQLWLVSRRPDIAPTVEHMGQVARAVAAVAARPVGFDPIGAVTEPPAALDQHVAALHGYFCPTHRKGKSSYRRHLWSSSPLAPRRKRRAESLLPALRRTVASSGQGFARNSCRYRCQNHHADSLQRRWLLA